MVLTYGSTRGTPTNISFSTASGGSLTGSGTIYLSACYRTRQGFSLLTTPTAVSYSAGQKIVATVAAGALTTAEAKNVHEIIIAGSASNSAAAMVRLGSVRTLQADQVTPIALPLTLELTRDAHIALSQSVANAGALPSGSDRIEGQIRFRADNSTYYRWDAVGAAWVEYINWTGASNGFTVYIGTDTDVAGGCDRQLQYTPSSDVILPVSYTPNGSPSTPVRYALLNGLSADGGAVFEKGQNLAFKILQGTNDVSTWFSGKLLCRFVGVYTRSDGSLDTTNQQVSAVPVIISQTAQNVAVSNYALPDEIGRGEAALFEISIQYNSGEYTGNDSGVGYSLYFEPLPRMGLADSSVIASGSQIFPGDDLARIVPSVAGIKRLAGTVGIRSSDGSTGYIYRDSQARTYTTSLANTTGQKVAISAATGNDVVVRAPADPLGDAEGLRALIGTATGNYTASAYTAPVSVTGPTGSISGTITIPTAIRSNYPDVIAGSTKGDFNVPRARIYAKLSGTVYDCGFVTLSNVPSVNYTITSLGSSTTLSDSSGTPGFCLWDYSTLTANAGTSGSLVTGSYEVAISWEYPTGNTRVTSITHSVSNGCIPEVNVSNADLATRSAFWGEGMADAAAFRAMSSSGLTNGETRKNLARGKDFYWDSSSTATDPTGLDANVIQITGVTTGRWLINDLDSYVPLKTVSGTSYTFTQDDFGKKLLFTSGSAITATFPSSLAVSGNIGKILMWKQVGAGQITFVGSGITVTAARSYTKSAVQYSEGGICLEYYSSTYYAALSGDLGV